jgi:hypothetical protein
MGNKLLPTKKCGKKSLPPPPLQNPQTFRKSRQAVMASSLFFPGGADSNRHDPHQPGDKSKAGIQGGLHPEKYIE